MNNYPTEQHFRNAYLEMRAALEENSQADEMCEYCARLGITSFFEPERRDRGQEYIESSYGSVQDLSERDRCPFCRLLWRLLYLGNENCCKAACRKPLDVLIQGSHAPRSIETLGNCEVRIETFYVPTKSQIGWITVSVAGQIIHRHIAYGDLHTVHTAYVDYIRVKEWLATCESTHKSCNEQFDEHGAAGGGMSDLIGHSTSSLRLIDVELRRVIQSLSPLRYVTLSYVCGDNSTRIFEETGDIGQDVLSILPHIRVIERQPKALVNGKLARTFEDAIAFTKRLGERYLWIDSICIPQDQPVVKMQQISWMDKIYSGSVCTLVSLASGVEYGLPGASPQTRRHVQQHIELLPNNSQISAPLMDLSLILEEAAWYERAWTVQEYLLSRRSVFFGDHQVFLTCKEMSARESWTKPHTPEGRDDEEWADLDLPLHSNKRSRGLMEAYKTVVQMYSVRNLTFADDRHRAFGGIQGRLSQMYDAHFLWAMPASTDHFLEALLWSHESQSITLMQGFESSTSALRRWPHWSWLGYPGGVSYVQFSGWSHRKDLNPQLHFPDPRISFHLPNDTSQPLSPASIEQNIWDPIVLKVHALTLKVDVTWRKDRRQSQYPQLEVWKLDDFPTARGTINFNIGIVLDKREIDGSAFSDGTKELFLVRLNKKDQPKVPWAQMRNEPARTLPPLPSSSSSSSHNSENSQSSKDSSSDKSETPFSAGLEWVAPSEMIAFSHDTEPDACLLMVESKQPGEVGHRLGVAYVRMMDFLVAGADLREILIG